MPNKLDEAGQGSNVRAAAPRTRYAQDEQHHVRAQVLRNWPWSVGAAAAVYLGKAMTGRLPEFTGVDVAVILFAVPVGCIGGAVGAERLTRRWQQGR